MKRSHRPEVTRKEPGSKGRTQKPPTPDSSTHRSRERCCAEPQHSNQHVLRNSNAKKPLNISPDMAISANAARYEGQVKANGSPKQRSRSTVSDRQPWGQLLSKHTGEENETVFGKFDPLRTLHFLAGELQTKVPDETNVQEIIKAMHAALKRIPPEVASTVQLQQQSVEVLSKGRSRECVDAYYHNRQPHRQNYEEFQKLIECSTLKLEASCRHLEDMCGQLKDEKLSLETRLQGEKANSKRLQSKIDEMEDSNRRLTLNLLKQDEEVGQLRGAIGVLEGKLEEKASAGPDLQQPMMDLKKSKLNLERENQKLEHQLRLRDIEKEKLLAILAVRDRQIYEIRNEMTQLQQSVNEQLVELHNYATSAIPHDLDPNDVPTISSIWPTGGQFQLQLAKSDNSLKNSDSEDEAAATG
ncbi:uncharacterized protein LOC125505469 [Dendroctonus ponderosae]|uniref:Cortactin-binding protein-2 N-terminal domain-containing protein n=1 Tax=Dendroctonus ponderosae TaxID=77166 RepID=A0AAR5QKA6_DENPD|nr:uncharacterized protein LOC109546865 [Dendroctonus ponderosae]XP_048525150.1 uncharacterized protein LOC109546865 [Dendroctonus ponderosae]XP_048525151.1 uncharacterized protein LOC109546865 [Dendroctonus ponderosae]XP_048525152.1 uncharacterized protein LOC125505423 [Dendroctonus ponderosae]XP_048525153.1 uncharacterized protein LOC125505423 [Dendroctonus ponderosae]XP_048525154.1 uncharacterized protein LOC125505423 [Dendroctonus ponderosae]XP_048525257.1 uncharacterized protein LOC12550